ncbi:hypothetical protein AXG55_11260 [Silvanigrella aquatica]|uniref:Uncharacterized protein n=1 Tax=Silvanigrella aquatica TaxID=1915309 RepID=A0A1L4D2M0_9BACT|nr:hypothetical protein AXG55_11260 [Silvanigrella aquatica]
MKKIMKFNRPLFGDHTSEVIIVTLIYLILLEKEITMILDYSKKAIASSTNYSLKSINSSVYTNSKLLDCC